MAHILFGTVLLLMAGLFAAKHRHRRFFGLRRLLRSLDASPAQERALRDLIHSARDQLHELHRDGRNIRQELGDVLRAESLDDARMAAAEAKVGGKMREAADIVRTTLKQMHEILDRQQRDKLADFITYRHPCYRCDHC